MEAKFLRKLQNAPTVWSFFFERPPAFSYQAGDYAEIALAGAGPHGDKRWFSMASSPTEPELQFTIKIPQKMSEYKEALMELKAGETAELSPPIGTFNLPRDDAEKMLFVAGGVGITPYRSMLKYLEDSADPRNIVLIYVARPSDFIFGDVIEQAHIPMLQTSDNIDFFWLKKTVFDWQERTIYLAGPQPFCERIYDQALEQKVPRHQLKLDYFEGYNEI